MLHQRKKKKAGGEYVGEYDENLTPENSCVIFICYNYCDIVEFTQINPKCGADKQTFEFKGLDNFCIFKPCKPGSRYQLTKTKGNSIGSLVKYFWDMDFRPDQQVLVFNVPKEPGIYCMQYVDGEVIARAADKGKSFEPVEASDLHPNYGALIWKKGEKFFKKKYAGTPWWDEFVKRKAEASEKEAEQKAQPNQSAQ